MIREQIYKAALEDIASTFNRNRLDRDKARQALEAAGKMGDDEAKPCTKCGGDGYYYCDESGCEAAHRCRRCKL